jgi:hypothetical protein
MFAALLVAVAAANALAAAEDSGISNELGARSVWLADRLLQCRYSNESGAFLGMTLWQSGSALESVANVLASNITFAAVPRFQAAARAALNTSFTLTPELPGPCYADNLWWLLAWLRAYSATGDTRYLLRAAAIFDDTATNGWSSNCGGGVMW